MSVSSTATTPAETETRRPKLARAGLVLVALGNLEVGIWGLIAPHSFFDEFPGAGRHWVSALGSYNEHLVRDYAAAELGFAILLALAALWFSRNLVVAAGAAFLVGTLPHFAYHLTTTGSLKTSDNIASLGAFVLEMAVVAVAMRVASEIPNTNDS